jgi:P4 family phage/plasmid primase-like protien
MTTAALNTPKDYALCYHDMGFSVFVLMNPETGTEVQLKDRKRPAVNWELYQIMRSSKIQFDRWFSKNPKYNLALVMGRISGNAVSFDVDGPTASKRVEVQRMKMSSTLREALDNTMMIKTGGGGRQIIFRVEGEGGSIDDISQKRIWSDGNPHSEILMQGNEHYIIPEPSIHPNGNKYEWNRKEPQTISRQELDEFIRLVSASPMQSRPQNNLGIPKLQGEVDRRTLTVDNMQALLKWLKPHYEPGTRDYMIFYLSGAMRKTGGFAQEDARRLIAALCEQSEYPDEDLDKSLTVVDNTYRKPLDELNGKSGLYDLIVASHQPKDENEYQARLEAYTQICQIINGPPTALYTSSSSNTAETVSEKQKKKTVEFDDDNDDDDEVNYDPEEILLDGSPGAWLRRQKQADEHLDVNDALVKEILRRDKYRTFIDTKEVVWHKDGVFHYGGEERINAVLEELGAAKIKNARRNEIIQRIKIMTYTERDEFDKDPTYVIAKNGVVDLLTGKRLPHDPDKYPSLIQIPHNYYTPAEMRARLATRPVGKRMICRKIVGEYLCNVLEPQDIILSIEYWGYDLIGNNWLQKALMCTGPPDSGKSTHVDITEAFLGKENCANKTLKEITINRFAKAGLYGKMANTCADISNSRLEDIETFKMIVSGDDISAENKGQDPFNFPPRSKLHFSANTPPLPKHETDEAYYKRWILLLFAMKKGVVINRNLLKEIKEDENELDDLLYLAVQAAGKLLRQQGFSGGAKTYDIDVIMEEYLKKAKPITAWVDDNCVIGREYEGEKDKVFEDFKEYCKEHRLPYSNSKVSFAQELTEIYHVDNAQRGRRKEKRRNVWVGISLIEDLRPEDQTEILGDDKCE